MALQIFAPYNQRGSQSLRSGNDFRNVTVSNQLSKSSERYPELRGDGNLLGEEQESHEGVSAFVAFRLHAYRRFIPEADES